MIVILNPYANRWGAKQQAGEIHRALKGAGLHYTLVETKAPGQAKVEAFRAAREGRQTVVVAGGDGSVSEAAFKVSGGGGKYRSRWGFSSRKLNRVSSMGSAIRFQTSLFARPSSPIRLSLSSRKIPEPVTAALR